MNKEHIDYVVNFRTMNVRKPRRKPSKSRFQCAECGRKWSKLVPRCPHCGHWDFVITRRI